MNDVKVFDFDEQAVRVIDRDGEPWFVAADVCRALDLETDTLRRLDDDERLTLSSTHFQTVEKEPTSGRGGSRRVALVSESGLYALVLGSRKPEAKRFKRWVTHEVLPSIRRTGRYAFDDDDGPLLLPPLEELHAKVRMVDQCRRLYGIAQARALWRGLGLPRPRVTAEDVVEDPLRRAERLAALAYAGVDKSVIAIQEGCTRRQVELAVRFNERVCQEVKDLVSRGLIRFSHAKLLMNRQPEVQRQFAAALASGELRTEDDLKCALAGLDEGALNEAA